jgi:hypothetical protein
MRTGTSCRHKMWGAAAKAPPSTLGSPTTICRAGTHLLRSFMSHILRIFIYRFTSPAADRTRAPKPTPTTAKVIAVAMPSFSHFTPSNSPFVDVPDRSQCYAAQRGNNAEPPAQAPCS